MTYTTPRDITDPDRLLLVWNNDSVMTEGGAQPRQYFIEPRARVIQGIKKGVKIEATVN